MCCREGLALWLVVIVLQLSQATGQNECNGVLTFQAFQNDEAFILDVGTDVTAFCIQCVNPSTGIADTNISWIIDGAAVSFSDTPPPAPIAVTSTGLLFVADSTSVVPRPFLVISGCIGDTYVIINIIVAPSNCTLQGLVPILCSHDFIPECLSEQFICNGVEDCSTGLDEVDCGTITTCPNESQELPCSDLATLDCIPTDIICNGNPDCQTGLDEINCDGCRDGVTCEEDPMICIAFDEICDGIAQCPGTDPIDEQFCNGLMEGGEGVMEEGESVTEGGEGVMEEELLEFTIIMTLSGFSEETFEIDRQEVFQEVTAFIVNTYCMDNPEECAIVTLRRKRQIESFAAEEVVLQLIENSGDDEVEVSMFVVPFNSTFELLSQQALFQAVQSTTAMVRYSSSGFQVVNVREFRRGSGRGFRLSNALIVVIVVVILIPVVILLACLKGVSN